MRGDDEQQLGVFSYVNPEQRVPQDHPLRPLRVMTDEALRELQRRFSKPREDRTAIDSAGEAIACTVAASTLLRAQRTHVDGTTRLQPVVPLVRRPEHGRGHLGRNGVHEESPPAPSKTEMPLITASP